MRAGGREFFSTTVLCAQQWRSESTSRAARINVGAADAVHSRKFGCHAPRKRGIQ
jgi:hypothetical protein